jgi:hypothetical protein
VAHGPFVMNTDGGDPPGLRGLPGRALTEAPRRSA